MSRWLKIKIGLSYLRQDRAVTCPFCEMGMVEVVPRIFGSCDHCMGYGVVVGAPTPTSSYR